MSVSRKTLTSKRALNFSLAFLFAAMSICSAPNVYADRQQELENRILEIQAEYCRRSTKDAEEAWNNYIDCAHTWYNYALGTIMKVCEAEARAYDEAAAWEMTHCGDPSF